MRGSLFARAVSMTAQEFVALSTKLVSDMTAWTAEASKDEALSASDLGLLQAAMKIIDRVTLREAEVKPTTAN